jgi:hypothetical protein
MSNATAGPFTNVTYWQLGKRLRAAWRIVRSPQTISTLIFAFTALYLIRRLFGLVSLSLSWGYVHDSPLMIYAAYLIDQGAVPYRDIFEMNTPGTYFLMWLMGKMFGWDNLSFRLFDLTCLSVITVCSGVALRRFGVLTAIIGPVAFALWYLGLGPNQSLQREYMGLVPLAVTLAVLSLNINRQLQSVLVGFGCGFMVLIKPQFVLFAAPLGVALVLVGGFSWRNAFKRSLIASFAFMLPVLAALAYLWRSHGLLPFIDIASHYWGLYAHLSGNHQTVTSAEKLNNIVAQLRTNVLQFAPVWAILGLTFVGDCRRRQAFGWLFGSLLILSFIYPAIGGQFWQYHWMPFFFMAYAVASLCASGALTWGVGSVMGKLAFLLLLFLSLELAQLGAREAPAPIHYKNGAPEKIRKYLSENMQPGDTVQPLDWTLGAVHGMLLAKARLATRFMYDFHFYHHVSIPYIQGLRAEFMTQLVAAKPRYIVQMVGEGKPWPRGNDSSRSFAELDQFLIEHYHVVSAEREYNILERNAN